MKILIGLLLLLLTTECPAQILKNIKNKVVNKGKSEVNEAKYNAKQKARQAARNELNGFKADFDSTDLDYAILLSDNSGLFGGRGRGEFGAKFLRLAGIARSLYQDQDLSDEENARLNLQMGQTGYAMGKYVFAEKRFRSAQSYFERAYMKDDLGYLKTLTGQGLLYTSMGRFKQAEFFTSMALDLRMNKFGKNDMGVAASYNNYAVLHYNLGLYNESEKEFARSLSIILANNQQSSMANAIVLNNQAILFQSVGRYEAAEKSLKDALAIAGENEVSKSKNHLKFFSNLALLYQQMGKYEQAEEIYRGLEKRLERGKPEFANMLNNVAILLLVMNRHDRIEGLLQQSAEIYKSNLGENSPAYAKVISDLGNFYRFKEKYSQAEPLLQKALEIRGESLGEFHPLYIQSKEDMAILLWKKKDYEKAGELYRDVMEKSLDFINKYFPPMSEAEKTKYWDIMEPRFQRYYNFAVEYAATEPGIIFDLLEYRLATKGLLLSSTRKVSESILSGNSQELINDYTAWIDNKEQLTGLYAYSKEDLKEQGINIDSLESATNAMEKSLSERSKEFAQYYYTAKVNYDELRNVLKPDEAMVEIMRLRDFDQTLNDSCQYLAIAVTKESQQPKWVVLDNGYDMENKIFKAYRRAMTGKINDDKTYFHFWEKIDPLVAGKKKIFFSPDGVYNQVNIYTLKKSGDNFLIKKYDIELAGNLRDIITDQRSEDQQGKKAILIGNPDFGSSTALKQLPATKVEVDGINKLLKSSGYQVNEYLQNDATEDNLKSASAMSVLHIATHGYFLPDVQRTIWPIGVQADYARDNVLLRSGLMLTGAADADKHTASLDNASNGIVTSYEAMNLNLKGTNLVVLSACETGLGEIKAGEGVYGLQRAFLMAGARSIIMSLWKVDDAATQELMNNFYASWTKTGDMQQSFKNAQLQLMTKHKEPYYWGAFVMVED